MMAVILESHGRALLSELHDSQKKTAELSEAAHRGRQGRGKHLKSSPWSFVEPRRRRRTVVTRLATHANTEKYNMS